MDLYRYTNNKSIKPKREHDLYIFLISAHKIISKRGVRLIMYCVASQSFRYFFLHCP